MRKSTVKLTSLALSAGVLLTSCSVGNTQYVANYTGGAVPTGVFVLYELNNAKNRVIEEITQADPELIKRNMDGTLDDLALYGTTFNGQLVEDLIVNRAKKEMVMLVGADAQYKALGLSQTEQEKQQVQQLKDSYKYSEDYFDEIGVSLDSWQRYTECEQKRAALFNYYYGAEGKETPKEEELKQEFNGSYINVMTKMFSYGSDEDKKEKQDKAKEFLEAAKKDGFLQAWYEEETKQNEERAKSLKERREKLEEEKKKREEKALKKQEEKAEEGSKASADEAEEDLAKGDAEEQNKVEPDKSEVSDEDKPEEDKADDEDDEEEDDMMRSPEKFEEKRLKEEEDELKEKLNEKKEDALERLRKDNTILNKKANFRTALSKKEIDKIAKATVGDLIMVESASGKAFWVVEKLELSEKEFKKQQQQVLHDVCDSRLEAKLVAKGQELKVSINENTVKAFRPTKLYKKDESTTTEGQDNW